MLLNFLQKQKELNKKIKLIKTMINSLNISKKNKDLYLESIKGINEESINNLYKLLINFVEEIEIKEIKEIKNTNFLNINWMRKKEAEEKKQEINSFSFLLHNL